MTGDRTASTVTAAVPTVTVPRSVWTRPLHHGFGLVLAGVLVPIVFFFALGAVFAGLDWIARHLGVAEERMPKPGGILLSIPAAGLVFTLLVLLTLLFPEGRQLLSRASPDPAARKRYVRLVVGASLTPFLLWGLGLTITEPLFARSTRESWGWILEVIGFAGYGLCLWSGLAFVMCLPLRLLPRCLIGAVYAALVGYLIFPFTLVVALSASPYAL